MQKQMPPVPMISCSRRRTCGACCIEHKLFWALECIPEVSHGQYEANAVLPSSPHDKVQPRKLMSIICGGCQWQTSVEGPGPGN